MARFAIRLSPGGRPPPEQLALELDEEFAFHLEQLEAELVSEGMTPEAARAAALEQFGDPAVWKHACMSITLGDPLMKRTLLISTVVLGLAVLVLTVLLVSQSRLRRMAVEAEMAARLAAEERQQTVMTFMEEMLTAADPQSGSTIGLEEVLDAASMQIDSGEWAHNPEVEQRLRQAIEDARDAMRSAPANETDVDEHVEPAVPDDAAAADEADDASGDAEPDVFTIEGGDWMTPDDIFNDLDALADILHARHSYSVLHEIDIDAGLDAISEALPDGASEAAFALHVERFIGSLRDAHASVRGEAIDAPRERYLPFTLEPVGDRYVALRPGQAALLNPAAPYVTHIDGEPIETWVEAASAQVNRTTPQWTRLQAVFSMRDWARTRALHEMPWTPRVLVTLTSDDGGHEVTVMRDLTDERPSFADTPRPESGLIDNGRVGYLRLVRMNDEAVSTIERHLPWLSQSTGLIIDVRGNSGGTRDALVKLYPQLAPLDAPPLVANAAVVRADVPDADAQAERRRLFKIDDPRWSPAARAAIDAFMDTFEPNPAAPVGRDSWRVMVLERGLNDLSRGYDKPVVILTDGLSFSATDIFVAALAQLPNVTVMGEPTGGGSGMSETFNLPSGLRVKLSQMVSYQPSGALYDGVGFTPDVIVERTADDVIGKTDSARDAAIAYIQREREAS